MNTFSDILHDLRNLESIKKLLSEEFEKLKLKDYVQLFYNPDIEKRHIGRIILSKESFEILHKEEISKIDVKINKLKKELKELLNNEIEL
jgi:(p)ppGpp synthase/HD superfamily hydrolase